MILTYKFCIALNEGVNFSVNALSGLPEHIESMYCHCTEQHGTTTGRSTSWAELAIGANEKWFHYDQAQS